MKSARNIIALGIVAGGINTIYAATHNRSVFKVGLASFLVVGALLATGTWNDDVAMMMAVLYFLSSFFLNGEWIINVFTELVGGTK